MDVSLFYWCFLRSLSLLLSPKTNKNILKKRKSKGLRNFLKITRKIAFLSSDYALKIICSDPSFSAWIPFTKALPSGSLASDHLGHMVNCFRFSASWCSWRDRNTTGLEARRREIPSSQNKEHLDWQQEIWPAFLVPEMPPGSWMNQPKQVKWSGLITPNLGLFT